MHESDQQGMSPEAVWDSLTPVERTALQVSFFRILGANLPNGGQPLYDVSCDKAIVDTCVPLEKRDQYQQHKEGIQMMAMRTAEIDEQLPKLASAEEARSTATQVVILGAGLDSRAWRLRWPRPESTTVFEVDTGSMEAVKLRALAGFELGPKRVFVQADLAKVGELRRRLHDAGFKSDVHTVWLLEGLVGYLTTAQSYRLFRMMHTLSPPGSRVLLTCPPSPSARASADSKGWKLHHITFEEAEATFQRLVKAGWSGHINKAEDLVKKYGLDVWQSQIVGCKPEKSVRPLHTRTVACVGLAVILAAAILRAKVTAT